MIYDNLRGDHSDGVAIYEFNTNWKDKFCDKINLWFMGQCDSPYISNHAIYHLKEIDSGISILRLRIKLREWIRSEQVRYIKPPSIPEEIKSTLITDCPEELKLTHFGELVALIKSVTSKCGESLIALYEKYVF